MVLLEFQSRIDARMALRILTYTGLIHQELVRNKALPEGGLLPPVLPVVLYNGDDPWNAVMDVRELIARWAGAGAVPAVAAVPRG